jgi:hypothetical protein
MTIEYVPRSAPAPGGSWRTAPGSSEAPVPSRDEVHGLGAVRVPVVPRRVTVPIARWWIIAVVLSNGLHHRRGEGLSFSVSWWLFVAAALVAAFVLYRWLRLRPLTATDQRDVVLSSIGIHTAGLVVPWSAVDEVVRFGFATGPGRGGPGKRSFVAVRVDDFVRVQGLSPARAGIANLTRRHLVVLCEAREVHNPTALADALDELVANPVARELLSGMEGQRLVATGPSWRAAA